MPTSRTVAQKMGVRDGARVYFRNAPADAVTHLDLPKVTVATRLTGEFDHLFLFLKQQSQFSRAFSSLKQHLAPRGTLWVAWPKAGQLGTDLDLKIVIKLGYDGGLVESTNLRIDDVWTALKFTHPKPGKTYRNSYGTLPSQRSKD